MEREKHAETRLDGGKWAPGYCPNPGGRPKGSVSLVAILLQKLREQDPDMPARTRGEAVVESILAKAKDGDTAMLKELLDRTDGKVSQPVDVTRKDITETVATIRTKLGKTREPAELN